MRKVTWHEPCCRSDRECSGTVLCGAISLNLGTVSAVIGCGGGPAPVDKIIAALQKFQKPGAARMRVADHLRVTWTLQSGSLKLHQVREESSASSCWQLLIPPLLSTSALRTECRRLR
eukprot:5558124-Amphidinium_carterae.1